MGKEIITFSNTKTLKNKFTPIKLLIYLEDAHIEKVLVSNKISPGDIVSPSFVACIIIIKLHRYL